MPRAPGSRSVEGVFRPLSTYQIVIDAIVAAAFAVLALPLEHALGVATAGNVPVAALLSIVFGGALAVRRLSPPLALALAWAGAAVQMAFGRPPGAVDLAVFAVLYTAAAYGSRRVFWLGFSSALVGAAVATVYVYLVLSTGPLTVETLPAALAALIAATFALLLAWTAGALVRTAARARADRLARERARTDAAAEQERTCIARDMHDVVAHSLAVVIAQADGARYAGADPRARDAALGTIASTARAALADVRVLLAQLRHRQEDGPQPTAADLETLFAQVRAAGLALRVDIAPAPRVAAPTSVQLAVYRILQEALTNALRHGAGAPVDLRLAWHPDRVELSVRNALPARATVRSSQNATSEPENPHFVTTEPGGAPRGHGLIGMRERALLTGGTLDAGAEGAAFIVRARIPISGPA